MSAAELERLLEAAISAEWVVEFGCGGSTKALVEALPPERPIFSVETDGAWIAKVQEALEDPENVSFIFADIGPTLQWGHPVNPPVPDVAARYHEKVWARFPIEKPGLCLVDGRFRVATALQALLHMALGSTILFHDFRDREHFTATTDFLGVDEYVDSMAVLKLDRERERGELQSKLTEYYTVSR